MGFKDINTEKSSHKMTPCHNEHRDYDFFPFLFIYFLIIIIFIFLAVALRGPYECGPPVENP